MTERRYPAARGFRQITKLLGVDTGRVLRRAQLPAGYLTGTPRGVTAEVFFRLWTAMIDETGNPLAPVHMAESVVRHDVAEPVCRAITYAPDLLTALERLSRFKQILVPARTSVRCKAGHVVITVEPVDAGTLVPDSFHLTHFAWLLMMTARLTGQPATALWTSLSAPSATRLPAMFGEIRQGPAQLALSMADAQRPIPTRDDAAWAGAEAELIRDLNAPLSARVRAVLRECLPSGEVRVQVVARELYLSQRTFQRQLASEGTTYQQLLDEVRAEMARGYLTGSDLSTEEIAYLLAFRDTSSFFRAFQGWTGMTPGEMRRAA